MGVIFIKFTIRTFNNLYDNENNQVNVTLDKRVYYIMEISPFQ